VLDMFKKKALTTLLSFYVAFFCPLHLEAQSRSACDRLITMSPSLTEAVYELGLGANLVGVSSYSNYPPEASQVPRVGGLLDPNLEVILSSRPDLIILLREQAELQERLLKLGLKVMSVDHGTVSGILDSLTKIGETCNVSKEARQSRQLLEKRIATVQRRVANKDEPRVMVVIGVPEPGLGLGGIFVSGDDGFYHEMLQKAGGQNAHSSRTVSLPMVSVESLMAINPEVIIHIATAKEGEGLTEDELLNAWHAHQSIGAVMQRRVYLLSGEHVVVPGPRFIDVLEEMADILHPEREERGG